jgi:ABC-2 type transport system permease protein
LWLLSARDLKVRYSTSALGYLWSILDPLVMSAIYWFVFTVIFQRGSIGAQPYIVFLIAALLPWVWFQTAVSDFTKAFKKDARLVRSTAIPRSIWVMRPVLSKGIEFFFSMPVLIVFVVGTRIWGEGENVAHVGWGILLLPVAILLQAVLLIGIGLLVAPLCALYTDLERTTALIMRALFYASPIIYAVQDIPGVLRDLAPSTLSRESSRCTGWPSSLTCGMRARC